MRRSDRMPRLFIRIEGGLMAILAENSLFIKDLIEVLHLPKEMRSFTIHAEVNKPVMVYFESYAEPKGSRTIIKRWILTKEEVGE